MAQQLCQNSLVCPGSDSPFANVSSEAPDPLLSIGVEFCVAINDSNVGFYSYPRICFSDLSFEDAQICAASLCAIDSVGWVTPFGISAGPAPAFPTGPLGGGGFDPSVPPGTIDPDPNAPGQPDGPVPPGTPPDPFDSAPASFTNSEQSCTACCQSGPCETFVMGADKIAGRTQAEADYWAKQFACRSAAQLVLLQCPDATCLIIDGALSCEPNLIPPYSPPPHIAIYWNGPQSCEAQCPDGTINVASVAPGRFNGRNQAQADSYAQSYACRLAYRNRFCVTSLQGGACLGTSPVFTISAFGGSGAVSWELTSGALPDGLVATISGRSINITGTTTVAGDFTFSFRATDSLGHVVDKSFSITVLGITNAFELPTTSQGSVYNTSLNPAGGAAPYMFTLVSGILPQGITLGTDGLLSGTVTESVQSEYPFRVAVKDAVGRVCQKDFSIFVSAGCLITSPATLPAFDQGQPYSYQMTASGGTGPYHFTKTAGSFPVGISISSSGLISGTPVLVNGNLTNTCTIQCQDSSGPPNTCSDSFTLPILDYHDFPPGKHWRITGYADGVIDGSCCQVCTLCNVWNGTFINKFAPADFTVDPTTGITNNLAQAILKLSFGTNEWEISIGCVSGPPADVYTAHKLGSNAGAQLDSPAGVYTRQSGCALNATITIEEY